MNTKAKLQTFFDSKRENIEYIEKYEENKDFFDELLTNGRKEEIEFAIPIKMYKYADSLNKTGNYKKALIVLHEIERDLNKIKGQSKWYSQYLEGATFLKGVCLGRLKKYSESNIEFMKVLKNNPKNDRFIEWYKSNKKNQISKMFYSIMIAGLTYFFIIIIIEFTIGRINNLIVRELGLAIAVLAYLTSFIWAKMIDRNDINIK